MDDMTYGEILRTKQNIELFISNLKSISEKEAYKYETQDIDFFIFISKEIIFLKNLYLYGKQIYIFAVLISDFYNYILSILKNEHRYIYLNERSIIENYIRLILYRNTQHFTFESFDTLKETYPDILDNDTFSLLKSEYREACGYIHGGDILKESLSFYFDSCMIKKIDFKNKGKYYNRISRLLKIYNRILIKKYPQFINDVFHRRKSFLKYLLGSDLLEFLFTVK